MARDRWIGLAERARKGDRRAYGELVEVLGESLSASVFTLVNDWHVAQDVAQEAFVAVYRQLGRIDSAGQLRAWLFRVARNRAITRFRKRRRRRTGPLGNVEGPHVRGVLKGASCLLSDGSGRSRPSEEALEKVREAVLTLPNGYGSLLVMRYVEEMSVAESAFATDRSAKAVRSALYRARIVARNRLEAAGLDMERILHEM